MSLWLMAAALERQTRSQEIRAVCAEAMQGPTGPAYIQARRKHIRTHEYTEYAYYYYNCFAFHLFHEVDRRGEFR